MYQFTEPNMVQTISINPMSHRKKSQLNYSALKVNRDNETS